MRIVCFTNFNYKYKNIHLVYPMFNHPDVQTKIFWKIHVKPVAADALVPRVTKSSGAMVLIMHHDKRILVIHEEGFPLSMQKLCKNAYAI